MSIEYLVLPLAVATNPGPPGRDPWLPANTQGVILIAFGLVCALFHRYWGRIAPSYLVTWGQEEHSDRLVGIAYLILGIVLMIIGILILARRVPPWLMR